MMSPRVRFSRRAAKDLDRLSSPDARRVRAALSRLAIPLPRDLDVVPLVGHAPWLRLRVGDFRVLFLPEGAPSTFLVVRVVNRRDLERAVAGLG